MADGDPWFVVSFRDPRDGELRSVRARTVSDSELGLGFIAISDFVFDRAGLLVDPTQDALERRLANVKRLHLNLYNILAIEEIGRGAPGLGLEADRSNLVVLRRPHGGDEG